MFPSCNIGALSTLWDPFCLESLLVLPLYIVGGVQNGAVIVENSWAIPQKAEHRIIIQPSHSTPTIAYSF